MKLWIIGKVSKLNHKQWEFQGIFDDEPVAAALCVDETWFVGPVYLNEQAPLETTVWLGAYYPRANKEGGLIGKTKEDEQAPVPLEPGVSYVSKETFKKYGTECFRKLLGVEKTIPIKTEKDP